MTNTTQNAEQLISEVIQEQSQEPQQDALTNGVFITDYKTLCCKAWDTIKRRNKC